MNRLLLCVFLANMTQFTEAKNAVSEDEFRKMKEQSEQIRKEEEAKIAKQRHDYLKKFGYQTKLVKEGPGSISAKLPVPEKAAFFYKPDGRFLGYGPCKNGYCYLQYLLKNIAYDANTEIILIKAGLVVREMKIFFGGHNEPELGIDPLNWMFNGKDYRTVYIVIGKFSERGWLEKAETFRHSNEPFKTIIYLESTDGLKPSFQEKFDNCDNYVIVQPLGTNQRVFCASPANTSNAPTRGGR